MNIVFDLDGTLADCKWRRPLVEGKPRDWDKFNLLSIDDKPNKHVESVFLQLHSAGHRIYIVTGRMKKYEGLSRAWLNLNRFHYHRMLMRKDNDFRPDNEVKQEILESLIMINEKPDFVFDDRDSVVEMWRRNGIPCFQVDKWIETKNL